MMSYLWLQDEPRFASLFEQNNSPSGHISGASTATNKKKKTRVPVQSICPQDCDSAKHSNAISAITDKISKEVSKELNVSALMNTHRESLNLSFVQSIKDGMKDLKDGMMEMAQYQMETAQYQAMASVLSPMKKDFYAALYNNIMDSMSYKVQKRALEQQEMAMVKRRLAIEDTESKLKEKELMLKNMELDCKLINKKWW